MKITHIRMLNEVCTTIQLNEMKIAGKICVYEIADVELNKVFEEVNEITGMGR